MSDEVDRPEPPREKMRWQTRVMVAAMVVVGLGAAYLLSPTDGCSPSHVIEYSTFYRLTEQGEVAKVTLRGQQVDGVFAKPQEINGQELTNFRTQLPAQDDPQLLPLLRHENVAVTVMEDSAGAAGLLWLLPWVVILGGWYWLWRRARHAMGDNPLAGVLKPRTTRFERQDEVGVRFIDVAGMKSAKRDLGEIIDFLGEPSRFQRLGGKMPRGVLLVGAPGTGKTLLARAVAGEAGVPFFSITGSEFIELYVGVGAARVRELFASAKKAAPSIIFIDEIDAVGRSRGTGLGGGHDEREQTLNQLLAEMDGFARNDEVVVMAATNRPDVLDPALLRPGRFDRRVVVELPAQEARLAILEVHTRDKPLADDVSLEDVANATPGYSGADLANLMNEAALLAIRRGAERIDARDISAAQDKIQLGDPRETRLTVLEKRRVAVHEAGHAVMAHLTGGNGHLRRVSIIPRGMSLGATQQALDGDRHVYTQSELEGKLRVLLGGYAAERLFLGETSTGAEDDLRRATELAQRMVAQLGMSERIGPMFHEHHTEHPFLGARIATSSGLSDATVHEIEEEARRILGESLTAATETLNAHQAPLRRLVEALLAHETLDREEIVALLGTADDLTISEEGQALAS